MRVRKLTWKKKTLDYASEVIVHDGTYYCWTVCWFDDSDMTAKAIGSGRCKTHAAARAEIDKRVKGE